MSGLPIVVGYDASPGARAALDFAVDAAQTSRLGVEVVHAWMRPLSPLRFALGDSVSADLELKAAAEKVLAEATDRAKRRGCSVAVTGSLAPGPPAQALL